MPNPAMPTIASVSGRSPPDAVGQPPAHEQADQPGHARADDHRRGDVAPLVEDVLRVEEDEAVRRARHHRHGEADHHEDDQPPAEPRSDCAEHRQRTVGRGRGDLEAVRFGDPRHGSAAPQPAGRSASAKMPRKPKVPAARLWMIAVRPAPTP